MTDTRHLAFLSPESLKRHYELERRHEEAVYARLMESRQPEDWDDFKTKMQQVMLLNAKTWKPVRLFNTRPMTGLPGTYLRRSQLSSQITVCPAGRFAYANHTIPKTHPLTLYQGNKTGVVYFSDTVVTPVLWEMHEDNKPTTWMGITPAEMLSQRQGVRLAQGRVVIGGLGLGWFLNAVCQKRSVSEVIVVDREKSLLDWLTPVLKEKYPALHKVKKWVCADIYNYIEHDQEQQWTRYLLDIWESYPGGPGSQFYALKEKLQPGHIWGWGDIVY